MASLVLYGRHSIRRRMSADGVVEHLNVAKNIAACFLPCRIDVLADALTLQQLEEVNYTGFRGGSTPERIES